jgi:hypothetical protein
MGGLGAAISPFSLRCNCGTFYHAIRGCIVLSWQCGREREPMPGWVCGCMCPQHALRRPRLPPTAFAAHGFRRPRLSPPTAFADPHCSAVTPLCVPGVYLTATACCQGCGHLNVLLKLHRGLQTLELEGNEISGAGVRLLVGAWVMCMRVVMKGGARGWMCGRWLWRGMPSTRGMQSLRL